MHTIIDKLTFRFILTVKIADKAIELYRWLISEIVLAVASDSVLDRYTDLAYGKDATYNPSEQDFRRYLFPWEEHMIDSFFPKSPARILIGGAGGGREALALVQRGYEVVAFEASHQLAHVLQAALPVDAAVIAYQARYEDLPIIRTIEPNPKLLNLTDLGDFDAAIVGWGSFVHLRNEEQRVHTLKQMAKVTKGPLLVSFFARNWDNKQPQLGRFRRLVRGRYNQDPGNFFYMGIGFHHYTTLTEFTRLVHKAGLKLLYINIDTRDTNWPHAIVTQ